MEKLSKAYASLPGSEPLKADIFAMAQDLEKNGSDQLVRTELVHVTPQHLLAHRLKIESEITAPYNEVVDSPEKYKGNAVLAIMSGSLFHP